MVRKISLNISFFILWLSLVIMYRLNINNSQWMLEFFNYSIGIDKMSILFIVLTNVLSCLCIMLSWNIKYRIKEYIMCIFLVQICLINVFCMFDLFMFYVNFELVLIPMVLLIGIWGSRERRVEAAFQFFIYTLLGSFFMLVALLMLYMHIGSCDIRLLISQSVSDIRQIIVCLCLLIAFAVKVPMFPVHLWLPEAHVEASTPGSVILAGVLLKLGTYGIIRFMVPSFPVGCAYLAPLVFVLSLLGVLYGSCTTLRQVDLKKIVAYSSVAHMNLVMLGLFSFNFQAIEGALVLMLSHGFVSSALFICVGFLYERYKTRVIYYYGVLVQIMPIYVWLMGFFIMANLAFPGTSNFLGEFLILIGLMNVNIVVTVLAGLSMILSAAYNLWFYITFSLNLNL